MVSLVGPIARRVYDQFVRASVKSALVQRDIILEAMGLLQLDIKGQFRELPVSGEDILEDILIPSFILRPNAERTCLRLV